MRRLGPAFLAIALLTQVSVAAAQPSKPAAAPPAAAEHDWKPIVIGLGAIAGVVAFNVIAIGVEALPGGLAYEVGQTVPAEASVAISRVYATTSAVIGGLLAYYAFGSAK